jgi:D-glycero-D-manno-heptose 1,7-bisphosphate phosphatase
MFALSEIDASWTLFLDRDGVINQEKDQGYILHPREFVFNEGVRKALPVLAGKFGRILIATNQRGIGKGLMNEKDLGEIHRFMLEEITLAGGRIDRIYYCGSLSDEHPLRKPNPGMALEAKKDYPEIDLHRSVMVGNTMSDMEFGRNAGMHTVYLRTTRPDQALPHPFIDLAFHSLYEFAKALH